MTFVSSFTPSLVPSFGFPRKAEKINGGVRREVPHSSALS
jgi:hypothetical protein